MKRFFIIIAALAVLGAAVGGGLTYMANGRQKVAVAAGFVSPAWPLQIRRAKIVVFGLEGGSE